MFRKAVFLNIHTLIPMKRVRFITVKGLVRKVRKHVQLQLDKEIGIPFTIEEMYVSPELKYVYAILSDTHGNKIKRLACIY